MANEENHYCMSPGLESLSAADLAATQGTKAAVLNGVKWPNGTRLRIKFLAGSQDLWRRVREVAMTWTTIANIGFEFTQEDPAQIRIDFQPGRGSWSYLGTVSMSIPANQPTMNYGWLNDQSKDDEVRRVVLHEFGHALGLIHEHQNPRDAIRWNRDAVIQDLSGPPNNWSPQVIEENMFKKYDPGAVTASGVDKDSIMMYPIPASWTEHGYFSAGLNSDLTETDKLIVRKAYPR